MVWEPLELDLGPHNPRLELPGGSEVGLVQKRPRIHPSEDAHRNTPVTQPVVASTTAEKEEATEADWSFWFSFPRNKTQVHWV